MPGYKIILYVNQAFASNYVAINNTTGRTIIVGKSNHTGTILTVDNTNGTKCKYVAGLNDATSCRVYYDNVEIPEIFSTTGT